MPIVPETERDQTPMPSLYAIAEYWQEQRIPELDVMDWGEPFCFACRWYTPLIDDTGWKSKRLGRFLQKAHLIDHSQGGPNVVENLMPLCIPCHQDMLEAYDNREDAIAWIFSRPQKNVIWQIMSDTWANTDMTGEQMYKKYLRMLDRIMPGALASF